MNQGVQRFCAHLVTLIMQDLIMQLHSSSVKDQTSLYLNDSGKALPYVLSEDKVSF